MNEKIAALIKAKEEKVAAMEALLATAEDKDFTEEEQTSFDELKAGCESLDGQIARLEKVRLLKASTPVSNKIEDRKQVQVGDEVDFKQDLDNRPKEITVPATARFNYDLKCFKGADGPRRAYAWGQQLMAMNGSLSAAQWCGDHGVSPSFRHEDGSISVGAVHQEGVNTQGGYVVLPEFDRDIINLSLEYGVFERNARRSPMTSDVKDRDRKTGGLTMHAVGEGDAGTESTMSWDQVKLVARNWMVLARISNQLNADAIIDVADALGDDVALASAKKKDDCGFLGTGTSAFHGIVGTNKALQDVNGVDEGGGIILGTGNLMSETLIVDFTDIVSILPTYARKRAKWYCSPLFFFQIMVNLGIDAGGTSLTHYISGPDGTKYLGYPVEFCENFPTTDADSQILALFGDLRLAADFGDRQDTTIAFSDSATIGGQSVFERNQRAVRWTERWDINVHDVGTATVAGPVVGLMSAAS